jgi:DNA-binding IclR family transcriptional regulator
MTPKTKRPLISTIAKGMKVLAFIADSKLPAGITRLSKTLNLSIGAVQRITSTLSHLGYLRKATDGQGYILGSKAWALGLVIVSEINLRNVAHPYLIDLSDKVGEIVNLGVLDDTAMLYIDSIKTNQVLSLNRSIGTRLPAYSTSLGKAIVAFLPVPEIKEFLNNIEMKPFTRNTITNKKKFLEELRSIRNKGFSINNAENDNGIRSVAAPVRDKSGRVVASVNISMPSVRVTLGDLQKRFAREVIRTGKIISEALGYKEDNKQSAGFRV